MKALLLAVALLLVPAAASAHTGSIADTQACGTGTTVTAHLDANVADTSTWTVTIDGSVVDSGSGPGPTDLGPYAAGRKAGSAQLEVDFDQEHHSYSTDWPAVAPCPIPRAHIQGPCGDPMYRFVLDNRLGSAPVRYRMTWAAFPTGVFRNAYRIVPAHTLVRSAWRHVLGGGQMSVQAKGYILDAQRSVPAGSYGPCAP